ncbi:hypothetical protein SAMN05720473_104166 [Fibrobacter sp. UWB15]|jgi:hypothetical protein|nr:hypothetical protein BGW99_10639 [Fibrobacter sp. UWB6]SHG21514.1 hypothetical protein SAMN05720760_10639 [Fibrobacter sp. UWB8]SMG29006.1 hypothetical protein SAMN05720473_104166 [Fibrobacter sp. UWB15]
MGILDNQPNYLLLIYTDIYTVAYTDISPFNCLIFANQGA